MSNPGWVGRSDRRHALSTEVRKLARDFSLVQGKLLMPRAKFVGWRRANYKLAGPQRRRRLAEIIAITLRFQKAGDGAREALAQLLVLAADLMLPPAASRT